MKITHCHVNHLTNPMGFSLEKTVFSFQVSEASGARLAAARLCVREGENLIYDSGLSDRLDPLAIPVRLSLKPRTQYTWTVEAVDSAGQTAMSEAQTFETGLMDEPWRGKWITCAKAKRLPIFCKRLPCGEAVVKARLYLCGLGLYEARLNGERIGDEFLTPCCTNYDHWIQYQTYDITDSLRAGGELEIELGDGWYAGRFGFVSKTGDGGYYGQEKKLIAQAVVTFADGHEEVIGTDEQWQVKRSRITFSGIYDGEHRDDTLPDAPAEPCRLTDAPKGRLTERLSLPVKAQETWKPAALLHTPAGETVLDLGQNFAGIFALKLNLPRGQRVHIQMGEVLQNGCFYRENLRTALAEYRYVSGGEPVVLMPRFTFYGYRYAKIEGVPNLQKDDFTAIALYSDLPLAGVVTTGHAKVNQLISNAHWGLRSNFIDVPTDCPQRDERMGWTGDAQVFSTTACYLRDSYAFYNKYLVDMASEQAALEGKVPDTIPSFGLRSTSTVWGDAACIIPWNLYRMYGDVAILAQQYDAMKAWVDYISMVDGDTHHWREVFHYGDWLALDNPAGGSSARLGGTDEGYIADVYYANSARIVSKTATLLGKENDAERYEQLARRVLDGLHHEYFTPSGRCAMDTQTALLLALRFPDVATDASVSGAQLLRRLKKTDGKLQTGFVGTPHLCGELCKLGQEKLAYDLLLNEDYPGWLYQVNLGATTIWERWNSLNPDGSVSSTGMNSFNHYAYGSIVEWLFSYAAGLMPVEDAPGFRQAVIRPCVDARLGHMDMTYHSACGTWQVRWKVEDARHVTLAVVVPFGCEATLQLPHADWATLKDSANPMLQDAHGQKCHLIAGSYALTYETDVDLIASQE